MMKRLLALIAIAALLGGCNTMAGVGQDVQRGGEKLEDAATKKK